MVGDQPQARAVDALLVPARVVARGVAVDAREHDVGAVEVRFRAKVQSCGVGSGVSPADHGAAERHGAKRLLQAGHRAAVLDRDVHARAAGGKLDLAAGVARRRIERPGGAGLRRHVAAQRDRIDGQHLRGAGQPGHLHHDQPDRPEPEHRHAVAKADVAVAHGPHREHRRVQAQGRLPAHARLKPETALGRQDVRLPEGPVREDPVAGAEAGHRRSRLHHGAAEHVADPIPGSRASLAGEQPQIAVIRSPRIRVSLEERHLGAVLGHRVLARHAHVPGSHRAVLVIPPLQPTRRDPDQFLRHAATLQVGSPER